MPETAEQLKVGVPMGSDSDMSTMIEVGRALRDSGLEPLVDYESRVVSAHRTPDIMAEYAEQAAGRGLKVIVAGAGGSAHLQGMTGSETILPVAGVAVTPHPEVMNRALGSCIGMPEGKPLATFQAKAGAYNAGLFAARILERPDDLKRVGIVVAHRDELQTMERVGHALVAMGLEEETDYTYYAEPNHSKFIDGLDARMRDNGVGVLVVSNTFAYDLPKFVTDNTTLSVLGVALPRDPDSMSPALNAIVNTPEGSPVAAFQGAAGAFNAGLKAARILALSNPDLVPRIQQYNESLRSVNIAKDRVMQRLGDEAYYALDKEALQQLVDTELETIK